MKSKKVIILPKHIKNLEIVGENIRLARKRRKLTLEQVSERAGIHRVTLYRIEKGDPSVSIGYLFNVLKTLNLHTDFFKIASDDIFGRKLQDLELLQEGGKEKSEELGSRNNLLSNQLNVAIKRGYFNNNSTITKVIGCSFNDLIYHLENNNYGLKVNGQDVDIDHIIPISRASSINDVDRLYDYRNLQLLPSHYNRYEKNNKDWDEEHFKEWFKSF